MIKSFILVLTFMSQSSGLYTIDATFYTKSHCENAIYLFAGFQIRSPGKNDKVVNSSGCRLRHGL